jgi:hypothetical protein
VRADYTDWALKDTRYINRSAFQMIAGEEFGNWHGPQKAVGAIAACILTVAYRTLKDGTCYRDLGHDLLGEASPGVGHATHSLRIRFAHARCRAL